MRTFPALNFAVDYRYICGRDNYTCQNPECAAELSDFQIFFQKIDDNNDNNSNIVVTCRECAVKNNINYRIPMKECQGRLIVITGPMFSQKSTTTKALYNKYCAFYRKLKPSPYIWIKPQIDSRQYGFTQTHDEDLIEAVTIDALRPDLYLPQLSNYTIVAFDEAQFFSERIIFVVQQLLKKGCLVIVNGLKLTAKRGLFGVIHYLMAEADEIHSLKAVCNVCEQVDHATRTKSFNIDLPSVSIGGVEQYFAVCPTCDGSANEDKFLEESLQKEKV